MKITFRVLWYCNSLGWITCGFLDAETEDEARRIVRETWETFGKELRFLPNESRDDKLSIWDAI